MSPSKAARLVAAGLLLSVSVACGYSGLSFVKDDRVEIEAPRDRAEVRLPVDLRWTVKDFAVTGPSPSRDAGSGYFGVFVDHSPQPPGKGYAWFAKDDHECRVTPDCPNEGYFAARGIYATSETSFTLGRLPEILSRQERERRQREFHDVVIVLLDGRGERIGESAFTVQFELKRDTAA